MCVLNVKLLCIFVNIMTMRQKLAIFSIHFFFHDQICECFYMHFIGRVLHNFTFHDNFARFSYVHVLLGGVEEIMQITCPAFHVHPISTKNRID